MWEQAPCPEFFSKTAVLKHSLHEQLAYSLADGDQKTLWRIWIFAETLDVDLTWPIVT
jgi:predicted lipid carrier protein YhbT